MCWEICVICDFKACYRSPRVPSSLFLSLSLMTLLFLFFSSSCFTIFCVCMFSSCFLPLTSFLYLSVPPPPPSSRSFMSQGGNTAVTHWISLSWSSWNMHHQYSVCIQACVWRQNRPHFHLLCLMAQLHTFLPYSLSFSVLLTTSSCSWSVIIRYVYFLLWGLNSWYSCL